MSPYPENWTELVNAIGFLITVAKEQQRTIDDLIRRLDRHDIAYLLESLHIDEQPEVCIDAHSPSPHTNTTNEPTPSVAPTTTFTADCHPATILGCTAPDDPPT